jgi:hypothetical protein
LLAAVSGCTGALEPTTSTTGGQAEPGWTTTGKIVETRARHTATLLADGRVLVAGGGEIGEPPALTKASAELYDPSTRSWTATGEMIEGRQGHTATLLPDGRVLVAGGDISSANIGSSPPHHILASAELYDPSNGTWTATGEMTEAGWGHTAILLLDGKVLVTGGYGSETDVTEVPNGEFVNPAASELYDPSNGTWTATGKMIETRALPTATLLPDGRVLVAGGQTTFATGSDIHTVDLASAELYDPGSGTWTATGEMTEARTNHTTTLLADGRVLVAGGGSAELWDPSSGTWTATGNMIVFRTSHTATLLPDGRVLVTGGEGGLASAELYDPSSGTWTATGDMIEGHSDHTATLLADGTVLVASGYSRIGLPASRESAGSTDQLASAELYNPRSET